MRRFLLSLFILGLWASDAFSKPVSQAIHLESIGPILFWITLIFLMATLGRYFARSLNQPGVLGELLMGVIFGNILYFSGSQMLLILREGATVSAVMKSLLQGDTLTSALEQSQVNLDTAKQLYATLSSDNGLDYLKVGYVLDAFSRYGVIFLLFLVGVESSLTELKNTGKEAFFVALLGVFAPLVLGFGVAYRFMPNLPLMTDLFVGATLCATSVGVTARIFKEFNQHRTREARTILGAAMIDDILGLFLLAVVSGVIVQGSVNGMQILSIAVLTLLFFGATFTLGPWLLKRTILTLNYFEPWEAKLIASFILVMVLAWIATLVQLDAIVGAFAAGLIIHDGYFEDGKIVHVRSIHDLVSPLEALLAPLFFMLIGMQVKLELFLDVYVLGISAALILAAVVGKLVSGLVASSKDDRVLIGLGMVPRGEVGLIFTSIGKMMGVLSDQWFAALVLMILVTTLITPPLLMWRFRKLALRSSM